MLTPLPDFLVQDAHGEIRIQGHRIRLIDVAARYDEGHSVEGIVLDYYPTLTLALVHKVVAFFLENLSEVRQMIEANSREMERLAAQPSKTPTLAELRNRMEAMRRAKAH